MSTTRISLAAVVVCASLLFASPAFPQETKRFDVPAQDAAIALRTAAIQGDFEILIPPAIVSGKRTKELRGDYSSTAALGKLLEGTGLTYKPVGARTFVVEEGSGKTSGQPGSRPDPFRAPQVETESITGGSPSEQRSSPARLEVLNVTAQRRNEAAQDVPISMTTLSARELDAYQIQTLKDVSQLSPNLLISRFSGNSPTIAIRGINNTFQRIGVNKPVAVVVDDVFIPRNSAADFDLFDLESVTVLRGPQGTLFGRNVTGGAVVINTRKPELDESEYRAQATIGNLGERQLKALANVPLNDSSAVSISASARKRDGYGQDRLNGAEEDNIDGQSLRGQFRLKPISNLEVLLRSDFATDKSGGRTLSSNTLGNDGNRRTSEVGVAQGFERDIWGASVRVTWQAPVGEVTSITAYRHSKSTESYSGVGANYVFLTGGSQALTQDADRVGTFTQEVRYASPKWSWADFVAGIYYLREDGTRQLALRSLAARTGVVIASGLGDEEVDMTSSAAYADGTVHLLPSLDLSLGARYTKDEKTASLRRTDFINPATSFSSEGQRTGWSQWTPRAALTWRPAPSALGYASLTRGFTSGGYNTEATTRVAFVQPFDPETVTNYEAGVKTQWLDNRLRFNLSVFRMKYKDKQELLFNSTNGILTIINAAAATIPGAELELAWRPAQFLTLSLRYAQLRGRYDSFVLGNVNNTGNPLASSPRKSGSASADWRYPIRDSTYLVGSVNHAYTSTYNTGAANDPNLQIPGYGLTNASIGCEFAGRWRVLAWIRNAANKDYILTRSTQVVLAEYLGEPRTFGVTFRAAF